MNRLITGALCAVLLLLAGCNLAPDYVRPEAPIPGQWPAGEAYQDAAALPRVPDVPALKWQDFFGDPNLVKLIELSLNNNRDLRLAALNVDKVRALYGIQKAELFPAVNATGMWAKERKAESLVEPGYPRISERYSVGVAVASWELDFFGRIRSLTEQALQEYLATEQARRSAQIALVSEVARTYLALAADQDNLDLSRSTLQAQQSAYDLVHKRYDAGLATELDLRRAQTPLETARVDIARYQQLVAQDRNALVLLAGGPVPPELLPGNLTSVGMPKDIYPDLPSAVLLRRPDVMAAEHRLRGANALIGAARAAFFPRIALTTSLGTASQNLSGLFGANSDTWSFAPAIVMPIFDPRVWAAFRASQAEQKIALTQYERAIQGAFRDTADALAVRGTIDRQVAAQRDLVKAVAETYRLTYQRYTSGIDSYLSVLDAQRSLYGAQQGLVTLRMAKLTSQVRLYAVLGGGAD